VYQVYKSQLKQVFYNTLFLKVKALWGFYSNHDSQPNSKHWELGCIFSAGAPGLYTTGVFALMTGGMSGNKLTGLTAIYLSKTGAKNEFPNNFIQHANSWKLEYFCHSKKLYLCAKAKIKKQPIRIFIQNRVCKVVY
jgi:hypothetical protein